MGGHLDPDDDRAMFRQLADLLRERIATGRLPPGALVPSEPRLMQETGLSRDTIRRAVAVLRAEGLVTSAQGLGTRVRQPAARTRIELAAGDSVTVRIPSAPERRELRLEEGVAVVVVHRASGEDELWPGDGVVVRTG